MPLPNAVRERNPDVHTKPQAHVKTSKDKNLAHILYDPTPREHSRAHTRCTAHADAASTEERSAIILDSRWVSTEGEELPVRAHGNE